MFPDTQKQLEGVQEYSFSGVEILSTPKPNISSPGFRGITGKLPKVQIYLVLLVTETGYSVKNCYPT